MAEHVHTDTDGGALPPMSLLPIEPYAARFPTLPIVAVVECLLGVWRDAELRHVDDDWMAAVDTLATKRLTAMAAAAAL